MSDSKLFKEFLAMQPSLTKPKPVEQKKLVKPLIKKEEEELTLETIIAKKPKPAKVLKYLQGMIDEIVAENED